MTVWPRATDSMIGGTGLVRIALWNRCYEYYGDLNTAVRMARRLRCLRRIEPCGRLTYWLTLPMLIGLFQSTLPPIIVATNPANLYDGAGDCSGENHTWGIRVGIGVVNIEC